MSKQTKMASGLKLKGIELFRDLTKVTWLVGVRSNSLNLGVLFN